MKTKKKFFTILLEKVEKYNLNIEEIQKIEFVDGKEMIWGEKWILMDDTLILRSGPSAQSFELGKKVAPLAKEWLEEREKERSSL